MRQYGLFLSLLMTLSGYAYSAVFVVNLEYDFNEFWNAAKNKSLKQEIALWDTFEAKHQRLYDAIVFDKESPDWQARRIQKLTTFLKKLPEIEDRITFLFENAGQSISVGLKSFQTVFPDFTSDINVFVMPSVFSFDGKAGTFDGKLTFFFGVDMAAYLNRDTDDIRIMVTHELAHVYHFSHSGMDGKTFATPLWQEGLATFMSGIANPGTKSEHLLLEPFIAKRCEEKPFVTDLARNYVKVIDMPLEDPTLSPSLYKEWFRYRFDGSFNDPGRKGYCLGLRVLETLSKTYSIGQMINWNESQYSSEVKTVLREIQ